MSASSSACTAHPAAGKTSRCRWPGLRQMLATRRQRLDLSALDSRALKDIGITREHADAEARRPFWDVPSTWRR